jgi:ABC-type lipoprotein release transport system permease subunit
MMLTPAFHHAHFRKDVAGGSYFDEPGVEYMELRLAAGVTEDELRAQVAQVAPEAQVFRDPSEDAVATAVSDRAIGLQAVAVLAVGIVVAVVSALFLLLGLSRLLGEQARDVGPLRAAGLSVAALRAITVLTTLVITTAGALGAVVVSVLLSPLSPVGLARRAEPDPGLRVELVTTLVGALATVLVALATALFVARRHAGTGPSATTPTSAGPTRLASRTSDVALATGLRFAGRRGGTRVATQLTVLAACVGVIGSLTFASSAAATVREPERYGWGWQLSVGNPNDGALYQRLIDELPDHAAVGAATAVHSGCGGSLDHDRDHADAPLIATEPLVGSIQPLLRSGRLPAGPDEVAIGAVTARQLGAEVGDTIDVGSADCGEGQRPLTVSGIAMFNDALLATRIGEGALVDASALEALAVEPTQGVVLVDPPTGMTTSEARAALRRDYGRTVSMPIVPGDLDALDRVRSLPVLVAAFVGVLALGTLGFTLGSSLRRSRRDVAVLKAVGLTPDQARRAMLVHALALVVAPAVVGTVLGVAAGRIAWSVVASGLGALDLPVVPVLASVAAVPAALLAATAIATRPALVAARTAPSITLRAE